MDQMMESFVLHLQVKKYLLDLSLDGRWVQQTEECGTWSPLKEEVFAGVVFCPNLEKMAYHWHLPWVLLTSTPFTCLLLPNQEASVFFAHILERCIMGHMQLMFDLDDDDWSQPHAHSEHSLACICCKVHNSDGIEAHFSWSFNSKASGAQHCSTKHNLLDRN